MSALFQIPSWTEIGLSILSCLLFELEVLVSNEETDGEEKTGSMYESWMFEREGRILRGS